MSSRYAYPQQLRPLPNHGPAHRALPIQKPNSNQIQRPGHERPANRKSYFQIIPAIATGILISIITLSTASLPIIISPFALVTRCLSGSATSILATFRRLWESVSKPGSSPMEQETPAVPQPTRHPQQHQNDTSHSPVDTPSPTQRPAHQKNSKPIPTLENPPFRFKYPVRQHFKRVVPQVPAYVPPPQAPSPPVMPKGRGQGLRRDKSPVTVFRNPNLPVRLEVVADIAENHAKFEHLKPEVDDSSYANTTSTNMVEKRFWWQGPMGGLKGILDEIPLMSTRLIIKDCDLSTSDVLAILSRLPYLKELDVRDVIDKPSLLEAPSKAFQKLSLESLTITAKVSLDPLFEQMELEHLSYLSLRLIGDGRQTAIDEVLSNHGNRLLSVRLRGDFSTDAVAHLRERCQRLPGNPSLDIGHICQSVRPRRSRRGGFR